MTSLGIDDGLVRRLRAAGAAIAWQPAKASSRPRAAPQARLARLGDEEARVEEQATGDRYVLEVAAGPVGAVVLLVEADRRGPPTSLGSRNARDGTSFPLGSIVAAWGGPPVEADDRPTVRDLVELARYALP